MSIFKEQSIQQVVCCKCIELGKKSIKAEKKNMSIRPTKKSLRIKGLSGSMWWLCGQVPVGNEVYLCIVCERCELKSSVLSFVLSTIPQCILLHFYLDDNKFNGFFFHHLVLLQQSPYNYYSVPFCNFKSQIPTRLEKTLHCWAATAEKPKCDARI